MPPPWGIEVQCPHRGALKCNAPTVGHLSAMRPPWGIEVPPAAAPTMTGQCNMGESQVPGWDPVSLARSSPPGWQENCISFYWATEKLSGTTTARHARNPGSIPPGVIPQSPQARWQDNSISIHWATDQPSGTTTARRARNPGSIPPGDIPQSPQARWQDHSISIR